MKNVYRRIEKENDKNLIKLKKKKKKRLLELTEHTYYGNFGENLRESKRNFRKVSRKIRTELKKNTKRIIRKQLREFRKNWTFLDGN